MAKRTQLYHLLGSAEQKLSTGGRAALNDARALLSGHGIQSELIIYGQVLAVASLPTARKAYVLLNAGGFWPHNPDA